MSCFELLDVIEVHDILGECILWDAEAQCAWWTDIHGKRLHRYTPALQRLDTFALPSRLCSFGLVEDDARLICAFAGGFAWLAPQSGAIEWLQQPEAGFSGTRFNDGRVDRQGRFWAGTMVEAAPARDAGGRETLGSLYMLAGEECRKVLEGISISNGLAWSPQSETMYFADSPTGEIRAYDFAADSGEPRRQGGFARTPEGSAPDGSTVDAEGCLWNAHWGGAQVVRYSPQGEILARLELPVSQPTCLCFGGPQLDWLFITTATENLDAAALAREPQAGNVFVYRTPYRGLPESRYRRN